MSDEESGERRKNPRVSFDHDHSVKVLSEEAKPVDISATGLMLEVSTPMSGVVKGLKLNLGPNRELELQGRVVRHFVHRLEPGEDGKTVVTYRVAIVFTSLKQEEHEILQAYVGSTTRSDLPEVLAVGITYGDVERRSERRVDATVRTGQVMMDFHLLQLSVGGMLVGLSIPLSVGTVHPFMLTVDDEDIEVQGEVLSCSHHAGEAESPVGYRAAIKFRGLGDAQRDVLDQSVLRTLAEREVAELHESL